MSRLILQLFVIFEGDPDHISPPLDPPLSAGTCFVQREKLKEGRVRYHEDVLRFKSIWSDCGFGIYYIFDDIYMYHHPVYVM